MIVMKFGGTTVAGCESIKRVISIVRGRLDKRPVVVVSALAGVTDMLYSVTEAMGRCKKSRAHEYVWALRARHLALIDDLLPDDEQRREVCARIDAICDELGSVVDAVCALGEITPRTKARVVSQGEYLSSAIIAAAFRAQGVEMASIDAAEMIKTWGDYLKGEPIIDEIERRVPECVDAAMQHASAVITQGYVGSNMEGETTVLARGGSDYTASLIGMALDAAAIEIWTDGDGVKTADPQRVANTRSIGRLSFEEATEMAHFGAKVLHPLMIEPAVTKSIPVYVLNTLDPESKGTVVLSSQHIEDGVKSVSFKERIHLLNIYSTRMINVSGFLSRVFDIFAKHEVSVDLISTSEANISLTIDGEQELGPVVEELSKMAQIDVVEDKSQVSIIGKNVVHERGLLRWAMAALNNVNIYMISQSTSFVNISIVVDRDKLDEVLNELHRYFFEY